MGTPFVEAGGVYMTRHPWGEIYHRIKDYQGSLLSFDPSVELPRSTLTHLGLGDLSTPSLSSIDIVEVGKVESMILIQGTSKA